MIVVDLNQFKIDYSVTMSTGPVSITVSSKISILVILLHFLGILSSIYYFYDILLMRHQVLIKCLNPYEKGTVTVESILNLLNKTQFLYNFCALTLFNIKHI